jgi:tetratricopeptide (TPR) repeat protein
MGENQKALQDAEVSLKEDKEFVKGLFAKAEALYAMGDFEYALMNYHRGNKLRPELEEFRLGIQKAYEAIDNCIGERAAVKLENKGDLSFFAAQEEHAKKGKGGGLKGKKLGGTQPVVQSNRTKASAKPRNSKTIKQLLGELYADREYLEKLMKDTDFVHGHRNPAVYELVHSGLNYLDSRSEFWQQQQPMYARKRERELRKWKPAERKPKKKEGPDPAVLILQHLEEIEDALDAGDAEESLEKAKSCMAMVESYSDSELPSKKDIIGQLHGCMGNAFMDLGRLEDARHHFEQDLQIAIAQENLTGKSRAYDNLGRVHAKTGNYHKAVESWTEKLPLSKTALEKAWLYHEIGRCHLEMGNYDDAHDFGEKALAAAHEAKDQVWELNSSVLIAQAEVKMDDLAAAIESFEKSQRLAQLAGDAGAEEAIRKALDDLNAKMVQSVNAENGEGEGDGDGENEGDGEHNGIGDGYRDGNGNDEGVGEGEAAGYEGEVESVGAGNSDKDALAEG